jgi:predicted ATP-grasp superfamily ATP-dependent carboligase
VKDPDSSRPFDSDGSRTPVIVLKLHHGSLGIARSLGRLRVPLYALHPALDTPAALSRYWQACFEWDIETAPPQQSVEYLLALGRSLRRRAILIPVSDRSAEFLASQASALREHFLFPAVSPELVTRLSSKKAMYFLAKELGIPTPETLFPQSREEVAAFVDGATFPVMLKGIDGMALKARTGRTMAIVHDCAELLEQYDRLEDPRKPNLMIQEYIPGGEDSVWMFNGYFNAASECLAGFTGRKIRQSPVYTGATSLGVCLRNDEVDATTRRFMKAVGYRGILDIGYRYDARDGRYKVLDVNPRIGSSFRLFVDAGGLDVARALYCDLTGQAVPRPRPSEGRKWIVEDQDVESSYKYWRDGKLSLWTWLMSFGGLQEGAWFARDDLQPFRAMCQRLLGGIIRARIARRGRATRRETVVGTWSPRR